MGSRYHVKIAGQGFLIKPDSYRRTASIDTSLGAQPSAPYSGWRRWHQTNWLGGDGQRSWDAEAQRRGEAGRWRSGYGIEIGEAGRVKLGSPLSPAYIASEDGFEAMIPFRGKLYAAPTSSGKIYCFDGDLWSVAYDTGKSCIRALARHGDQLYAGSGSDGELFIWDGAAWSSALQVAGASAVTCMASYGVWDGNLKATVPRLFLGCSFPGSEARVYQWDGTTLVEAFRCQEATVEAMVLYSERLYVATSDSGNGVQGRVLCFDGRSSSGEWSELFWLSDSYVASWAVFDNLLFCCSGVGGTIWAFDGRRLSEAYSLSATGLEYSEPLRAIAVYAGKLYVGYRHLAEGAALLCKLPAALIGTNRRVTGETWGGELDSARLGWYTPCTTGDEAKPSSAAVYGGYLHLSTNKAGSATIYRKDTGFYRSSGTLETSFFDGGYPETLKLLRSITVGHDKLLPGQQLDVQFALEDSDLFQQVEEFGDIANCDQVLTTADWRPADSLARLRGMPALGFSGKRWGDPAVPHCARKAVSTNPYCPPATITEEVNDSHYEAISEVGGGVAVDVGAGDGLYVHHLFEFDLAGLNPIGIRPKAICYGKGDSFGAPACGAVLRIWNHAASVWDLVGTNLATPQDSEYARTIETVIPSFASYLGPTGKLYLSLRTSNAGSAANPSELGVDLVELGALWEGSGEIVSRPLRLPASESLSSATLTLLSYQLPTGTGLDLFMSVDDGESWEAVESGVPHSFLQSGSTLRWKVRLYTSDGLDTPNIDRLKVDCFTGNWLPVGRSDLEGSASATFGFESGTTARQVAFRVMLKSSEASNTPALTSIALQYALQPETKRRWEMKLLCEGAAGTHLRLLDGSREQKRGRELSQILWQARSIGSVPFEDIDGSLYQVWVEQLEEMLSDAPQERGIQTVARCRLLEC
ncbi:MAG: hypothetical protein ACOX87_11580 [Chloroflexota bacterium]